MLNRTSKLLLIVALVSCARAPQQPQHPQQQPPPQPQQQRAEEQPPVATFRGVAKYEDGSPAADAMIAITSLASHTEAAVVAADHDGRFAANLDAGDYALAITTESGYGWIETMKAPGTDVTLTVSRSCRAVRGRAKHARPGTQIGMGRLSSFTGDVFIATPREDGTFSMCLPDGYYFGELRGAMLSLRAHVALIGDAPAPATFEIEGFARETIRQPPRELVPVPAEFDGVVTDILRRDARVIGLGEATHGTAELTTTRATLTFELIRRADLRLVLFEFDAIVATALDDYVMGRDVDLPKAVAALGFWITDTYELLRFFEDLRAHNAKARSKVRVWGVDVQQTQPAVELLLANARALKLTPDEKSMLEALADRRGRAVLDFTPARRTALDALLVRLARPRGKKTADLRIAVAARSLAVQVGYFDGDRGGLLGARRDAGMAGLASFLVAHTSAGRAAVWADTAHVARDTYGAGPAMGKHLADVAANRYYPIGLYVYEGSVRAWDPIGAIGVISHAMPPAADYTLEGAVMAATRAPDIAWLPVSAFSPALRAWTNVPRYVREVGAVFYSDADHMTLRNIPFAFDAVAVIKTGHDSSPTPTGIRKIEK